MEELVNIIKKEVNKFGIDLNNHNPFINQESYVGAYLSGITEYLRESKMNSIQEVFEFIKKLNGGLIEQLIKENIIPKGGVALSLGAFTDVVIHRLQKFISKRESEVFPTIQDLLVQKLSSQLVFYDKAKESISNYFNKTICTGMKILIYGYSRHIEYSLIKARNSGKAFTVYVTQTSEKDYSKEIVDKFQSHDIDCKLILGVSIGYYLSKIDIILTGADAVCENGGIINKIGTYTTAICAKNFKKPFYVLVDSLNFLKLFALDQSDLQQTFNKYFNSDEIEDDLTPPEFITLFFTDKGIFTPSAICDEIIQLFYN